MASGHTSIADIVVPEIFTPYALKETEEKSRLIRSGAVVADGEMADMLNGGGLTFNMPTYDDLDNDVERVADESVRNTFTGGVVDPTPNKIGTFTEVSVRLERNNSWTATKLAKLMSGDDPAAAIQSRVADYWVRRQQACFVSVVNGIFADNAAAPAGTEHVQNDMTNDISGVGYTAGVTDFSAEAFVDTTLTMGDSMEDLSMIMVHSVVYARMLKNNLIDFIPDSVNGTRSLSRPSLVVKSSLTTVCPSPARSTKAGSSVQVLSCSHRARLTNLPRLTISLERVTALVRKSSTTVSAGASTLKVTRMMEQLLLVVRATQSWPQRLRGSASSLNGSKSRLLA